MNRLALRAAPLALSFVAAVATAACSAAAPSEAGEPTASSEAAVRTPDRAPDYAYFFVDRTDDGFLARAVNETGSGCGREKRARCPIDDVDLSALGVSKRDARSLVDAIDDRSAPNALVFLGSIEDAKHGGRVLRAVEAWRAPKVTRWGGTVYQVTRSGLACDAGACRTARALRLNVWQKALVPDVMLDAAPAMNACRFVPLLPTGCQGAYDAAEAAEATPAGLLVAGHRDQDGSIVAEQYFLRVGVGSVCDDGGWNYCASGQSCDAPSGMCSMVCIGSCTHGRGRGVMPYEYSTDVATWMAQILATAPIESHIILPH